jgi:hypothetical protein
MNAYIAGRIHKKPKIEGSGYSFLLNNPGGSVGGFNSATVSAPDKMAGSGMSKSLEQKLSKLAIQPIGRKPKNIVFNI